MDRRGARPARKTTPCHHLPVLWRADEKIMEASTRLSNRPLHGPAVKCQPRATTAETSMHMIHRCYTISIRIGIFRHHGQGIGELRLMHGNDRYFPTSSTMQAVSLPANRVVSMPNMVCLAHALGDPSPQQPVQRATLQTQNAYHFAEASKLR